MVSTTMALLPAPYDSADSVEEEFDEHLHELFQLVDFDGAGRLSRAEFPDFVRSVNDHLGLTAVDLSVILAAANAQFGQRAGGGGAAALSWDKTAAIIKRVGPAIRLTAQLSEHGTGRRRSRVQGAPAHGRLRRRRRPWPRPRPRS